MHFTFSFIPWILTLKVPIPNSLIFWYCSISKLFQCRYIPICFVFLFCFFERNPHYFGISTSQVQRRFLYVLRLTFSPLRLRGIYKITNIVRALWLAERSVCMRVGKHGCHVRCFTFRALITQARIWTSFSDQNWTSLLYLTIPSSAETWKIFTNKLCQLFFA